MDADSSLATVSLGLALLFSVVLALGEGYLFSGTREEGDSFRQRVPSPLWDGGVRALLRVVLASWAAASGVALVVTLTPRWWVVVPSTLALLVFLVLLQCLAIGVGARWRVRTHFLLPFFWLLTLLATPLSWLHLSAMETFAREAADASGSANPPISLADGSHGGFAGAQGKGRLDSHERRMITSIQKLDETTVREVMVPRMDILASEATSSLMRVAELMWDSGHSRVPIYEESLDNIVGVVHSRDLLHHLAAGDLRVNLVAIARPSLFIPDSKRLDELLRDFQEKHIQIAIVVDEYGGVAGLVTIEDLLEEIVGEIEDEFDVRESLMEMLSDNEAVMDARISLEEVNEVFAVNLQGEGFDTLGGLLYQQMGKIPSPGDEAEVDGLRSRVLTTLGRRIKKVRVAKGRLF